MVFILGRTQWKYLNIKWAHTQEGALCDPQALSRNTSAGINPTVLLRECSMLFWNACWYTKQLMDTPIIKGDSVVV